MPVLRAATILMAGALLIPFGHIPSGLANPPLVQGPAGVGIPGQFVPQLVVPQSVVPQGAFPQCAALQASAIVDVDGRLRCARIRVETVRPLCPAGFSYSVRPGDDVCLRAPVRRDDKTDRPAVHAVAATCPGPGFGPSWTLVRDAAFREDHCERRVLEFLDGAGSPPAGFTGFPPPR